MQTTLTNGSGVIIARMDNGDRTQLFIYSREGRPLGYYDQVQDRTYSMTGEYKGRGDLRKLLIEG